ncbi:hypothetical protein HNP84_001631 [Thermocatellispora tengchongensis]|uniref:General stress protein 17M-like domain-containing protein n=1 Tax=Thermocatellispora tengchongensis TaxID=1073253 RepID=A0A840NWM1_9ACTN|nr:general stress protein [Thermocatellispora tengchongensis]MBB5131918.1 hypothetical protein [Thermocatellispora tengchongensis]
MPTLPYGAVMSDHERLGTYDTYAEAQKEVDYLSDHGFPVGGTIIVGVGLRLVERVLARMTYLRAAGRGALAGAWFGLLIGLFFGLFSPVPRSWAALVIWGLVWGAIAGAIAGLVSHAISGGERDFVSTSGLVAEKYEVLVDSAHAEQARALLLR